MANITTETRYVIELTHVELRLVGLALAGKLKGKEAVEARALNVRLLELRNKHLRELLTVAEGALQRANEENDNEEAKAPADG